MRQLGAAMTTTATKPAARTKPAVKATPAKPAPVEPDAPTDQSVKSAPTTLVEALTTGRPSA